MRILKYLLSILILSFVSCSDEPKSTNDLPVRQFMQAICEYESNWIITPANPPEYLIINSARDMEDLPEGTLAEASRYVYSKVDFAKYTLIVVTSVIYCEPAPDDHEWNRAMAYFDFKKGYLLNIRYQDCSVMPNALHTQKCKIQFFFTTDKIPSDTKITLTESMVTTK
ncbi:MAG: hypothetical protein K2M16_09855 [Muribaculaceae bacterium]|nr:hypothetical protein [Muribaculaceae bacterium]